MEQTKSKYLNHYYLKKYIQKNIDRTVRYVNRITILGDMVEINFDTKTANRNVTVYIEEIVEYFEDR